MLYFAFLSVGSTVNCITIQIFLITSADNTCALGSQEPFLTSREIYEAATQCTYGKVATVKGVQSASVAGSVEEDSLGEKILERNTVPLYCILARALTSLVFFLFLTLVVLLSSIASTLWTDLHSEHILKD